MTEMQLKVKIPTAQISRERYTGAKNWPRPEAARKSKTIYVSMSDILHVSIASVRMTKLIKNSLFFWY